MASNRVKLTADHYPNYDVYKIIGKSLEDLEPERNYFIEWFGSDNIGNGTVIISPITKNLGSYMFTVSSTFRGIINKYKRKFEDYQHTGYSEIIEDGDAS